MTGCADDTPASTEGGTSSTGDTGAEPGDGTPGSTSDGGETGPGSSGPADTGSTDGGTTTDGGDSSSAAATSSSSLGESSSTTSSVFVCDPIDLGSSLGEVHTGTTTGQSDDLLVDCVKFDSVELEFAWTAPMTGTFQVDTLGSDFDTALMVLTDDCYGTQLACNDDFGQQQSAVLVDVDAGETIVIVVDGYGGANGEFTLSIEESAPGDCCEAGFFGGCDDQGCEDLVCAVDPDCCAVEWDAVCALNYAPTLCAQCAEPGSCCFPQKDGGCNDLECEMDVCATDPSCCDTEWTQACADLAEQTCSDCIPLDCCSAHPEAGCGEPACEQIVCEEWDQWCCDQEWDEWCVQLATENCATCQADGPCCVANAGTGCEDPEVEQCVCETMPECCEEQWTGECAAAVTDSMCGVCQPPNNACVDFDLGTALGQVATGSNVGAVDNAGISCAPMGGEEHIFSWAAPTTNTFVFDTLGSDYDTALSIGSPDCAGSELGCDGQMGASVSTLQLDLIAGQTVVIVLDAYGAATGNYVLNINNQPGLGFCCAANFSPGCSNGPCEQAVCASQPSCCEEEWDDSCAMLAQAECATCQGLGDCCTEHESPGCNDLMCAAAVCDFDPFCCDTEWAEFCVEDTSFACPGLCEI